MIARRPACITSLGTLTTGSTSRICIGLLIEISATVLDPPADYPAYGNGYYAVFFADPDGIKLEFVYLPRQ